MANRLRIEAGISKVTKSLAHRNPAPLELVIMAAGTVPSDQSPANILTLQLVPKADPLTQMHWFELQPKPRLEILGTGAFCDEAFCGLIAMSNKAYVTIKFFFTLVPHPITK